MSGQRGGSASARRDGRFAWVMFFVLLVALGVLAAWIVVLVANRPAPPAAQGPAPTPGSTETAPSPTPSSTPSPTPSATAASPTPTPRQSHYMHDEKDDWVSTTVAALPEADSWEPVPLIEVLAEQPGEIRLRWADEPNHPEFWGGYRVWRSDSPDGPFTSTAEIHHYWNFGAIPSASIFWGTDAVNYWEQSGDPAYFTVTPIDLGGVDGPASSPVCATPAGGC